MHRIIGHDDAPIPPPRLVQPWSSHNLTQIPQFKLKQIVEQAHWRKNIVKNNSVSMLFYFVHLKKDYNKQKAEHI